MGNKIEQNDAIVSKAVQMAAYFRNNNKNLTKEQARYMSELWDMVTRWDHVKENLRAYGLM